MSYEEYYRREYASAHRRLMGSTPKTVLVRPAPKLEPQPEPRQEPSEPPLVGNVVIFCVKLWENGEPAPVGKLACIKRIVAELFGLHVIDLESHRRDKKVIMPRQIAMYVMYRTTDKTLPQVGNSLGNRDHTTVLYGIRKIERLIKTDPVIAQQVEQIVALIPSEEESPCPTS